VEQTADQGAVVPPSPRDTPLFAGFADEAVLFELAGAFTRRDVTAGSVIAERGQPVDQLYVVAHGKVTRTGPWAFGEDHVLGPVSDAQYLGDEGLAAESVWGVHGGGDRPHAAGAATGTVPGRRGGLGRIAGPGQAVPGERGQAAEPARRGRYRYGTGRRRVIGGPSGLGTAAARMGWPRYRD
jgi:hypothetical protein